jgi:hypothetical protein
VNTGDSGFAAREVRQQTDGAEAVGCVGDWGINRARTESGAQPIGTVSVAQRVTALPLNRNLSAPAGTAAVFGNVEFAGFQFEPGGFSTLPMTAVCAT